MKEEMYNKVKAIVIGHAVGDAVGGPVQFIGREERDRDPVTDMMPFGGTLPKGAWSDDTSMALCAMDAIAKHGADFSRVMENFRKWLYEDEFTPMGMTFDVGRACYHAIERSRLGLAAEECGCRGEEENGNGSLMRIYPFSVYFHKSDLPLAEKVGLIHRASALTHAHPRSCIGCGIYSFVLWELFDDPTKEGICEGLKKAEAYYRGTPQFEFYHRIFGKDFRDLPRDRIKSSGYVVDTLEAAIWCVLTTENYCDCVLKAVNLGLDTDTVGAVAGSLAGLLYGCEGIPAAWRDSLCRREYLEEITRAFCSALPTE